ncbi:MAG: hypothetical protein IIC91_07655 [Chloroflexi bacterium]|nr:hypothetical protein [Chloroflexota bacterium]
MTERTLDYTELDIIWTELALESHWNDKADFYREQMRLLVDVLENIYKTSLPKVAIENLEVLWYYAVRRYPPLVTYIKKKIKGKAGKTPKNVDVDDVIWAFVTKSVDLL